MTLEDVPSAEPETSLKPSPLMGKLESLAGKDREGEALVTLAPPSKEPSGKLDFYRELFVSRYYRYKAQPASEEERAAELQVSVDEKASTPSMVPTPPPADSLAALSALAERAARQLREQQRREEALEREKRRRELEEREAAEREGGEVKREPEEKAKEEMEVKQEPKTEEEEGEEEPGFEDFLSSYKHSRVATTLLSSAYSVLKDQRLAELCGSAVDAHTALRANADRLRAAFARGAAVMGTVRRCHWVLLRELESEYKVIYLRLLSALRVSSPDLVDELSTKEAEVPSQLSLDLYCALKAPPHNPLQAPLAKAMPKRLSRKSHFLLIEPRFKAPGVEVLTRPRDLPWDHLFKTVLPAACTSLSRLSLELRGAKDLRSVSAASDHLIATIRNRVFEVRKQYRDSEVVVVGWGVAGALALKAVREASASAVVALAFENLTTKGPRGDVDDEVLGLAVPALFVQGQAGDRADPDALNHSRDLMSGHTGLVLLGGADDNLRVFPSKLRSLHITQEAAEQAVAEALCEFLEAVWSWDAFKPQAKLCYAHPFTPTVAPTEKDKGDGKDPEVIFSPDKKPRVPGPSGGGPMRRPQITSAFAGPTTMLRPAIIDTTGQASASPSPAPKRSRPSKAKAAAASSSASASPASSAPPSPQLIPAGAYRPWPLPQPCIRPGTFSYVPASGGAAGTLGAAPYGGLADPYAGGGIRVTSAASPGGGIPVPPQSHLRVAPLGYQPRGPPAVVRTKALPGARKRPQAQPRPQAQQHPPQQPQPPAQWAQASPSASSSPSGQVGVHSSRLQFVGGQRAFPAAPEDEEEEIDPGSNA